MSETPADDRPWQAELYESGQAIVTKGGPLYGGAYLLVRGLLPRDVGLVADEIAAFLNRESARPPWLDDVERRDEQTVIGIDGLTITAEGPMARADDGLWERDESPAADDARARMIDRLGVGRHKPKRRRR